MMMGDREFLSSAIVIRRGRVRESEPGGVRRKARQTTVADRVMKLPQGANN